MGFFCFYCTSIINLPSLLISYSFSHESIFFSTLLGHAHCVHQLSVVLMWMCMWHIISLKSRWGDWCFTALRDCSCTVMFLYDLLILFIIFNITLTLWSACRTSKSSPGAPNGQSRYAYHSIAWCKCKGLPNVDAHIFMSYLSFSSLFLGCVKVSCSVISAKTTITGEPLLLRVQVFGCFSFGSSSMRFYCWWNAPKKGEIVRKDAPRKF